MTYAVDADRACRPPMPLSAIRAARHGVTAPAAYPRLVMTGPAPLVQPAGYTLVGHITGWSAPLIASAPQARKGGTAPDVVVAGV